MNEHVTEPPVTEQPAPARRGARRVLGLVLLAALIGGAFAAWHYWPRSQPATPRAEPARDKSFTPTPQQWATMSVEVVRERVFRTEVITEGKIAIDEDISTPVLSPYAGRVLRLLARPGERVTRGQPLFTIEATDAVAAQNELIAALGLVNKAQSQLRLARTNEARLKGLSDAKAVALREYQAAQAEVINAQNDARAADTALEAVRNRLRILGRTDEEIAAVENGARLSAETTVVAPIAGTIVARRVGPGQYIAAGSADPLFVIGDLSRVWIVAFVRESEATNVRVGQAMYFKVLAATDLPRGANLSYVSSALDAASRRLTVRATVSNEDGKLRPEMFASVTILTGEGDRSPAVPREAVLYEGDNARLWIVREDGSVELRQIKPGLISERYLQVLDGVKAGERVIVKGSVFIDREAGGG